MSFYRDVRRCYSEPKNWKWRWKGEHVNDMQSATDSNEPAMRASEPSAVPKILERWERDEGLVTCLALADGSAAGAVLHRLFYRTPAEDSISGWEKQSLPLGCGHFGWNVFGIAGNERVQVTHNAVLTKLNLTNALEIRLKTGHVEVAEYARWLDVDSALAGVAYVSGGVRYEREFFTSHPDRTGVMRLTASKPGALAFHLSAEVPFQRPFGGQDRDGRRGSVTAKDGGLDISEELEYYGVRFGARLKVLTDGKLKADSGALEISGATVATVLFTCDTNYRLRPEVFVRPGEMPVLSGEDPHERTSAFMVSAVAKGYDRLRAGHLADYRSLAGRVVLDLGADADDANRTTVDLLALYRHGGRSAYLEETYFQFGRYLLVGSSRPGTLPANLQGVWTGHDKSPWGAGYWHNINVQMNYWPVFTTNLGECFLAYAAFNAAFRPKTRPDTELYLTQYGMMDRPFALGEAPDIWSVGTSVYPYYPDGLPGGHSGPGMGGLTVKLFKDWWDFTRDREYLVKQIYPAYHGMLDFLSRCMKEYDGKVLSSFSASPEQLIAGRHHRDAKYYNTVGCAFDQQMIDESSRDFLDLQCAAGVDDDEISWRVKAQVGRFDPIQIGWSGQIKEYREEGYYGEIGEWNHRHISQLMALMPGTRITRDTPAWLDAVKVSLDKRGDTSTGWALAHRLNAWARAGEGDRAYRLLSNLLSERTYSNLWDAHPPFQIDGNFGAVSGIAEMLLHSHAGAIDLLPALPAVWRDGSYAGLRARGGYTVDCEWRGGLPVKATVVADAGAPVPKVRFGGKAIAVETAVDGRYVYTSFPEKLCCPCPPSEVKVDRTSRRISWRASPDESVRYRVLRNTRSAPDYAVVADGIDALQTTDGGVDFAAEDYVTYQVVAVSGEGVESRGAFHTCSRATQLEKDRYVIRARSINGVFITPEELD